MKLDHFPHPTWRSLMAHWESLVFRALLPLGFENGKLIFQNICEWVVLSLSLTRLPCLSLRDLLTCREQSSVCINDAWAAVKQTTVLAFYVPVYMPSDMGNISGSKSKQATLGLTLHKGGARRWRSQGFTFCMCSSRVDGMDWISLISPFRGYVNLILSTNAPSFRTNKIFVTRWFEVYHKTKSPHC